MDFVVLKSYFMGPDYGHGTPVDMESVLLGASKYLDPHSDNFLLPQNLTS